MSTTTTCDHCAAPIDGPAFGHPGETLHYPCWCEAEARYWRLRALVRDVDVQVYPRDTVADVLARLQPEIEFAEDEIESADDAVHFAKEALIELDCDETADPEDVRAAAWELECSEAYAADWRCWIRPMLACHERLEAYAREQLRSTAPPEQLKLPLVKVAA